MTSYSFHNANYLRRAVTTHKSKVCSLYKKSLRTLESYVLGKYGDRAEYRYHALLMRQRFEEKKDIKDLRVAKQLLEAGEEELWHNLHPEPMKFPYSPGGICYERYYEFPDWHLDYWNPMEKAQYPYYFARREQRKVEFVRMWETKYGKPAQADVGVTEYSNFQEEPETEEQKKYGPFGQKANFDTKHITEK